MSTTKISKIKKNNSEKSFQFVSQIHEQLKILEQAMKHYSLNDSLYFIQLTQKCFENEIAKEFQTYQ